MSKQQSIPFGYCQCGCGQPTRLARSTSSRDGTIKGKPLRYIYHHQSSAPAEVRFWNKVNKTGPTDCWEWTGAHDPEKGYGSFTEKCRNGVQYKIQAHRYSYRENVGPLEDSMCIDHLCRNPKCVNPAHLEQVTHAENVRRGAVCNPELEPQHP